MSLTLHGIKACDTMKKARAWLDKAGIAYLFHDYKAGGAIESDLRRWCGALGWQAVLNRSGTTFRKLPEACREALAEDRAIALMLGQPSMIKRPILEGPGILLAGFSPETYAAALGEICMNPDNQAQIDLWDGKVGEKWAAMQEDLNAMLAGATEALAARLGPVASLRVLDIGCGTGVTCQILLERGAEVTGVDVSTPMLAVAQKRTGGRARLVQADAAHWQAEEPFDLAVSQFGVMFFADPKAAFATIAGNIRPGGRLLFVCWRPVRDNAWVKIPMAAIQDLLPLAPPQPPHAPGPFGLADRDYLEGILAHAGFTAVSISPLDLPLCFAAQGGVESAVGMVLQIGPAASALAEADADTRATAKLRLREALAPHARGGRVSLGGAVWMVEAKREG